MIAIFLRGSLSPLRATAKRAERGIGVGAEVNGQCLHSPRASDALPEHRLIRNRPASFCSFPKHTPFG